MIHVQDETRGPMAKAKATVEELVGRIERGELRLPAGWIARHSRVNSSTIISIRNARPSAVRSITKS